VRLGDSVFIEMLRVIWVKRVARRLLWVRYLEESVDRRCCVRCGVPVSNSNLGGFGGRSALSGPLFCLSCEED
jgi:hypothetical protein